MATNAELIYLGETKSFQYTDGAYKSLGQKVINDGLFTRVDGGNVQKADAFIASYNYTVSNGIMTNLWVNFSDPMEAANVMAQISACFTALCADCKCA